MFCPKCSQQQFSDNVRFCSRCGFQLSIVKALIVDDDASLSRTSETNSFNRWRRKRDTTIGALLMSLFALHSAWTTEDLSLEGKFTGLIIKCLILCALINVIPMILDVFRCSAIHNSFLSLKKLSSLSARFKGNNQILVLPVGRSRPAANYFTGSINTAEFIVPPSVTEDTTTLLNSNRN